jgi:hypothetical protein
LVGEAAWALEQPVLVWEAARAREQVLEIKSALEAERALQLQAGVAAEERELRLAQADQTRYLE